MNYEEKLKNRIDKDFGFGISACNSFTVDNISNGIKLLLDEIPASKTVVEDCVKRFCNNDFGSMYSWDEKPSKGHEQGWYNTKYGIIRIIKDVFTTTICFDFER